VRTVFNVLGPLSNPAAPPFLVIGAFDEATAGLIAHALHGGGVRRAFVVHGAEGWDEPTPVGPFTLYDVRPDGVRREQRTPADYGLPRCPSTALAGGDAAYNALALARVLDGQSHDAHRDALLLGAALALEVSGREHAPRNAVRRAADAIDSGAARVLLAGLQQFGAEEAGRPAAP
jgi:anthranilate phosphoribosyltransferase